MSLLTADAAVAYDGNAANNLSMPSVTFNGSGITIGATDGRDGGQTIQMGNSNVTGIDCTLRRTVALGDIIYHGQPYYHESAAQSSAGDLLRLTSGNFTTIRGGLSRSATGQLIWFSATSTARATSTLTMNTQEWYWIECEVLLASDATGYIKVWVNGVEYINVSSVITASAGTIDRCRIWRGGASARRMDLFYLTDNVSTGDGVSGLQGDLSAVKIDPNADTGLADFSSTLGNGHSAVSAVDTNYIQSATAGHVSMFGHSNGIVSSDIKFAVLDCIAAKEAGGTIGVKSRLTSGSETVKSALVVPTTSKGRHRLWIPTDPNTSAKWEAEDLNNATIGVEASVTA